jgi:DNA-binding NarL/FixJ family response regulator
MTDFGSCTVLRATCVTYALGSYEYDVVPPSRVSLASNISAQPVVKSAAADKTLTKRQLEVLSLVVNGKSNKEIARALKLGEGTVKVHVAALFNKLGVKRRAAVALAGARFLSAETGPDSQHPAKNRSTTPCLSAFT